MGVELPPIVDHVMKGAALGAFVGGGIATAGWFIRQRNQQSADLGVEAPNIRKFSNLSDVLETFKPISAHSQHTRRLYTSLINMCEYIAKNAQATGGRQVAVQRSATAVISVAKRLCDEAIKHRDMGAYDAKAQIETLEGCIHNILQNMMLEN
jgi:hypothetical protein